MQQEEYGTSSYHRRMLVPVDGGWKMLGVTPGMLVPVDGCRNQETTNQEPSGQ